MVGTEGGDRKWELGTSPTADPLRYPGDRPERPYLLDHGRVRDLPADGLDERLDRARAVVVAAGSNATPARLVEKLGGDAVVALVRVEVRGLDLRYSAHLARYGSVPATAWPSTTTSLRLPALVLDAEQAAALDATEPNYDRRGIDALDGASAAVIAPTPIALPPELVSSYVSRHGWYRLPSGHPALPPAHRSTAATGRHGVVLGQRDVLDDVVRVIRRARPASAPTDVEALLAAVRAGDRDLTSAEVTALLAAEGRTGTG